jgi:hypothetical protein
MMNMSGSGGFILHAYKVYVACNRRLYEIHRSCSRYDDPNAHAVTSHRQKKKTKLTDAVAERSLTVSGDNIVTESTVDSAHGQEKQNSLVLIR